jgi:hypothetical protein
MAYILTGGSPSADDAVGLARRVAGMDCLAMEGLGMFVDNAFVVV